MAKIVVFGTGDIAQVAHFYFATDTAHEVVAFTVDRAYLTSPEFEGKPVIAFEDVAQQFPPSQYAMFVALGYSRMNHNRQQKYEQAKALGYQLVNYVSSRCSFLTQHALGDNCFVLEDNTIQPFVKIGSNVVLWSGNHIGHHSTIEDHVFISSHVVVSGHCTVGRNSFLGVNATLHNNVVVGPETLVGAGAIIPRDTEERAVFVPERTKVFGKTSDQLKF
jgi:sugar O-acyltransferase (sialic acid O-acetyltransferase NeuD family)